MQKENGKKNTQDCNIAKLTETIQSTAMEKICYGILGATG